MLRVHGVHAADGLDSVFTYLLSKLFSGAGVGQAHCSGQEQDLLEPAGQRQWEKMSKCTSRGRSMPKWCVPCGPSTGNDLDQHRPGDTLRWWENVLYLLSSTTEHLRCGQ